MISAQGRVHIVGSLRVLLVDCLRLLFCDDSAFEDRDLFLPREDELLDLRLDVLDLDLREEAVAAF